MKEQDEQKTLNSSLDKQEYGGIVYSCVFTGKTETEASTEILLVVLKCHLQG